MSSRREDSAFEVDEEPRDPLNDLGVLTRREIEARMIAPLLAAFGEAFGQERVLEITRQTIKNIARQQGKELAEHMGGCTLAHFAASLEAWKKDDALIVDVLEQTDETFSFNVTRCRYAELYAELGIPELGSILSCDRDFTLMEGFNPNVSLTRTQTIMEGAAFCDFRYVLREGE